MSLVHDIQNLALVDPGDRQGHMAIAAVNALVARGWVVRGSGDGGAIFQNLEQTAGPYNVFTSGVGYVATSHVWNTPIVANTISNARAWIRLKEPGASTREIIFQRANYSAGQVTAQQYLIARMALVGFTGGGATALSPPSAPGGDFSICNGTAGPAFNTTGFSLSTVGTDGAGRTILYFNMLISDDADTANVWPFQWWVYDATNALHQCAFIYDALDAPTGDLQPFVILLDRWATTVPLPDTNGALVWVGINPSDGLVSGQALSDGYVITSISAPSVAARTNWPATDGKVRALPVPVWTSGTARPGVWRGYLKNVWYNPTARRYPVLQDPTAGALMFAGRFIVPWGPNVVAKV